MYPKTFFVSPSRLRVFVGFERSIPKHQTRSAFFLGGSLLGRLRFTFRTGLRLPDTGLASQDLWIFNDVLELCPVPTSRLPRRIAAALILEVDLATPLRVDDGTRTR